MKAVTTTLYVCGGLMAAAAVMGAIDYKAAKQKGSLDNMYKKDNPSAIVKQAKIIEAESYSRAKIDRPMEQAPAKGKTFVKKQESPTKIIPVEDEPTNKQEEKTDEPVIKPVVKKRIRFSEFSRAALPRRYYEEKEMPKAIATDSIGVKSSDN